MLGLHYYSIAGIPASLSCLLNFAFLYIHFVPSHFKTAASLVIFITLSLTVGYFSFSAVFPPLQFYCYWPSDDANIHNIHCNY